MPARAERPDAVRMGAPARKAASLRTWTLLGRVETAAPAVALLRALRLLRPQCTLRVRRDATHDDKPARYRIEIADDDAGALRGGAVAPWTRVKSALIAAFPADKPNAVRALD